MYKRLHFLVKRNVVLLYIILCGVVVLVLNATMASVSRGMHEHDEGSSGEQRVKLQEPLKGPGTVEIRTSSTEKMKHIAFLKVHKTGSSTAQNIFMRFGWVHGLTFILSPVENDSGFPNVISLSESLTKNNTLPPPAGKTFDILCNHVFYNRKAFQLYLPSDTFYIGILREPHSEHLGQCYHIIPRMYVLGRHFGLLMTYTSNYAELLFVT